jgi:hypothetical protein
MTKIDLRLTRVLQYLRSKNCPICGGIFRNIKTEKRYDEQDKTTKMSMEYECIDCNAKEKSLIELTTLEYKDFMDCPICDE